MFSENKFTQEVERILRLAHECAREMGHGYVGSEHILLGILRGEKGKAQENLISTGVTEALVRKSVCERAGVGRAEKNTMQGLTPCARRIIKAAFDASIRAGAAGVESEHLLVGLVSERGSTALKIISNLGADIGKLARVNMSSGGESSAEQKRAGDSRQGKEKGDSKLLKSHARDLCELAREGRLDPVIGREKEISRMIEILLRRTKNNPLLLGEAGVGKTALAEGLAERIARGDVPKPLREKRVYMLDISGIVAGTKYRGEFEERIRSMLREVSRAGDIILFIDEIHNIVGAGAAEGAIDAANILKPALSRREIQIIGATTFEEYRRYIERDAALDRRFQPIKVEEPTEKDARKILLGLRERYERHHGLHIDDEAIDAAVSLSRKYLPSKRLPDKAIDLMDEALSRARIQTASPPSRLRALEEEIVTVVGRKQLCLEIEDFEGAAKLRDMESSLRKELSEVSEKWQRVIEGRLRVTAEDIAEAVSEQTGIPASRISEKESARLLRFEELLQKRVVGQDTAISAISRAVRRGRCGLSDNRRPIGSFLFAGPTGVGKTEVCRALSEALFDDEKKLIRIDMSEYMERHELSKLIGSPPGYIGHDESTTLVDRVRANPYSVVLFDEVEKAHPDALNILLQILEDGMLTDSHGKQADFKNTVIVMTSNIGAKRMNTTAVGFGSSGKTGFDAAKKEVVADIRKEFSPELINRIDEIVVFSRLQREDLSKICDIMISGLSSRAGALGIKLTVEEGAKRHLIERGFDEKSGARSLRRIITQTIEDALAEEYLKCDCGSGSYIAYFENDMIKIKHTA